MIGELVNELFFLLCQAYRNPKINFVCQPRLCCLVWCARKLNSSCQRKKGKMRKEKEKWTKKVRMSVLLCRESCGSKHDLISG